MARFGAWLLSWRRELRFHAAYHQARTTPRSPACDETLDDIPGQRV
jgi:hypothetical protein